MAFKSHIEKNPTLVVRQPGQLCPVEWPGHMWIPNIQQLSLLAVHLLSQETRLDKRHQLMTPAQVPTS